MALTYSTNPRQWLIDHSGRVQKGPFKIVTALFFAFACASTLFRFVMRLLNRKKLTLDDWLVGFALICLAIATAVLYFFMDQMFVLLAINYGKVLPTPSDFVKFAPLIKLIDIYLAFIWTATYAIKFSFLAFFYRLIDRISSGLTKFFWVTTIFTTLSWLFTIVEPYALCPYFDINVVVVKCYPNSPYTVYITLTALVSAIDIITDLLIIIIPILVLRRSLMNITQKLALAAFLCLSVFMIILTLIRIIGGIHPSIRTKRDFDTGWGIFWNQLEGCVAVIMASVAVFRSFFSTPVSGSRVTENSQSQRSVWFRKHLFSKLRSKENNARTGQASEEYSLSAGYGSGGATIAMVNKPRHILFTRSYERVSEEYSRRLTVPQNSVRV